MNIQQYCINYFFTLTVYGYFAYLLSSPGTSYLRAIITSSLMCFVYNFEHQLLHKFPDVTMNLHVRMHHNKLIKLPRPVELCIEYLFEVVCFSSIPLLFQYFSGIWIIPPSIIFFLIFTLTNVHILWYSMVKTEVHSNHHKYFNKNFGPSFIDHFLGINAEDHYEDMNQFIPFILMSALVVHFAKLYFQWKD